MQYKIPIDFGDGALLDIHLFNDTEHRWIFKHEFIKSERKELSTKVTIANDSRLYVNYEKGLAKDVKLSMNIRQPQKMGKKYFLGVDISEGSKLYLEFLYEKKDQLYNLTSIDMGSHGIIDLTKEKDSLVKQQEFMFPVANPIEREFDGFGDYRVPFLKNNGEKGFFKFPESYVE